MKKKKFNQLMSTLLVVFAAILMIFTNSCTKSTEPTDIVFTALPFACDEFSLGYALGITSDGSTVFGGSAVDTDSSAKYMEEAPVIWIDGQVTILPFMGSPTQILKRVASIYGVSENGVLVGNQGYGDLMPVANYYADGQWTQIFDPVTTIRAETAGGISADGTIIVGNIVRPEAHGGGYYFNWVTGQFVIVESTFKDDPQYDDCSTLLFGISEDGNALVGLDSAYEDTTGIEIPIVFNISDDTTATRLALPTGYEIGCAESISADGTTILGTVIDETGVPFAVYWDENYQVHIIGTFCPYPEPFQPPTTALAASNNGNRIVGTSDNQAFIKFHNDDIISLQDWLEDEGLDTELADWELYTATGISKNGHWICGTGRNGVYDQAFKVYIP